MNRTLIEKRQEWPIRHDKIILQHDNAPAYKKKKTGSGYNQSFRLCGAIPLTVFTRLALTSISTMEVVGKKYFFGDFSFQQISSKNSGSK